MKIKHINIAGFKSFCDPTRVIFDSSLTAVVGPNGCGKSNIVDAIRWGLGEQSPKNLRGKDMDDVIFNGSEKRGPLSMAEVTITFDNTDGLSHPTYAEFPEIAVTRRLLREGIGEYFINNTPCRLKDITELFLGTGGGARAYSIIEQGRIGLIVSSRSEDRRAMIEEAAGITRFKKARATSFRKMEQTRQNLLRVTDVISEMERSLSTLKRQASKALRYKKYAEEQRDLELYLAGHKYLELLAVSKTVKASLTQAESSSRDARVEMQILETNIETLRVEEHAARTELEAGKTTAFELDNSVQGIESDIRHLADVLNRLGRDEASMFEQDALAKSKLDTLNQEREVLSARLGSLKQDAVFTSSRRKEAENRSEEARINLVKLGKEFDAKRDQMSRARAQVAACQNGLENFERRIEEATVRLGDTNRDRKTINEKASSIAWLVKDLGERLVKNENNFQNATTAVQTESAAFERLSQEIEGCDQERQRVRNDLQLKTSRYDSLMEMNQGLERHDRAVREAVEALRSNGDMLFTGLLVDFIECPEKLEVALAATLSDRLQAMITNDHSSGMNLLTWLKERDLGRVTALATKSSFGALPQTTVSDPAVQGRLISYLKINPAVSDLLDRLLGNVYVVQDTEDALRLWDACKGQSSFVTVDGQLLDSDGLMHGGRANSPGTDLLSHNREIRELEDQIEIIQANYDRLEQRFEEIKSEMMRRRNAVEEARKNAQQRELALMETRKDKARSEDELADAEARRAGLDQEIERQEAQVSETRTDRDTAASVLFEAKSEIESLEKTLEKGAVTINHCRSEVDSLTAAVSDARVKEAQFEHQYQVAIDRLEQIENVKLEINDQFTRAATRRVSSAEEVGISAGRMFAFREELETKLDNIEQIREFVNSLNRKLNSATEVLEEAGYLLKKSRADFEEKNVKFSDFRMLEQQAQLDVTHLLGSVNDRYNLNLLRVLGDYHLRPIPNEDDKFRIDDLKGLIDRMGAINPAAIEDYEDTKTRFEKKVKQRSDVEQALEDLERAIAKMDRDSRRMFKETFESINEKFQKIFPRLFKGGQAQLKLTDSGDMLTTGVDIEAQPPGKRLGNIELMSGGEKALTAVSLLFAIFLHRPSPFCLLDEVDAPLDEANVSRFLDMLHEMTDRSQFIVITHSKNTMESSDALYGVTMQEPGVSKLISVKMVDQTVQSAMEN